VQSVSVRGLLEDMSDSQGVMVHSRNMVEGF